MTLYDHTRLLTTREVAEFLAVSPETILRRIRAGELPAIRIASNALRIRESELEAYLDRVAYGPVTNQATSTAKGER